MDIPDESYMVSFDHGLHWFYWEGPLHGTPMLRYCLTHWIACEWLKSKSRLTPENQEIWAIHEDMVDEMMKGMRVAYIVGGKGSGVA